MRALVVGAGSVGAVLTRFFEVTKANELTYYVRSGGRAKLPRIKLLDVRSGELNVRERPTVLEPGQPMPAVDTVIFAVRADQFIAAAEEILPRVPATARICSATPGLDDLPWLRANYPGRPTVQLIPMFLAYPDGDVIRWWTPPLARTLITWEGDDASQAFAEELAAGLKAGGLPSRALRSIAKARDCIHAAGMPVLASWELAGWDTGALAHDGELRQIAARGMKEALRAVGGGAGLLGLMPRPLLAVALRAAPWLSQATRDMWRVHGPKIAAQTRQQLDALTTRAGDDADALKELQRRLAERP